ncbi:MBL fold metallo-hydrolase [Nocardioides sp. zg-579]|uniref:MBL fold metallo-hydrolase n=1 Tax=Nocardioides marmotae TaxID=2663857 RepID=A0A6I3JE68_9ACTN|nr:MBL fold metallo-hydrolase [Nocardioides marmotae]MCR6032762.1 MBL fold metallo-hydrolase [Gordonia jinghuaiqii]MTB96412.1 MBL fold metallo-hydrolase [Nocardioides marmotae]QKE02061.1 MBL fold metallo-hydrolase [Nocardioides marmotae]
MRLKPGRPDLHRHASRHDVPPAADGALGVTFLGVSTLLVSDGTSAVLTDGFFTRPGLLQVGLGRIAPDLDRIDAALGRALADAGDVRVEAVVPVHSHYDHALDSAVVAGRTGALLVGGTSTANVGRGGGLPDERIRVVSSGDTLTLGAFTLTLVASAHCPPDRYPGSIEAPVVPPARTAAYRCGEAWSILLAHGPSGRTALVQGSAGYVAGSLAGCRADVAYLGVGQLGVQPESYVEEYWEHTVRAVGASRVVLTHWDDFFRPLDRPLRALPYAGDDLDASIRTLDRLATADGVSVHLPTLWRREDPWSGLPG